MMSTNVNTVKKHRGRILLAAPRSGSGKTTITCALLQALKDRGLDLAAYKCGPDYIDPMFHKKALGIESRNLDSFFAGAGGIRDALAGRRSPYAVIEGAMGLYDGLSVTGEEGSAYEIAGITDTPVVLIVDAAGIGRSLISLIKGMLLDDHRGLIRGIILNRITEAFYAKLSPVLEKEIAVMAKDVRLLGFFPKSREVEMGSRHLGLMLPEEIEDIRAKLRAAAALLESYVDLEGLIALMEEAEDERKTGEKQQREENQKAEKPERKVTLAVALDEAFCFYYRENLELFERFGVTIRYFSPIRDRELPEGTDGILLGGGYPENHLEALSQNSSMRKSIREAIEKGIPSLAECGGFMYLHRAIEERDGKRFEMAGVIDGTCSWAGRLVRFGYLEVLDVNGREEEKANEKDAKTPESGYNAGKVLKEMKGLKGHEFHYFESSGNGDALTVAKPDRSKTWNSIIFDHNGIWGFPHFYYPSAPQFIRSFTDLMKEVSYGEFK